MEQALGDSPDQQPGERRMPPGAHDDHVGALVWGDIGDRVGSSGRAGRHHLESGVCALLNQVCDLALDLRLDLVLVAVLVQGFEVAADAWYSTQCTMTSSPSASAVSVLAYGKPRSAPREPSVAHTTFLNMRAAACFGSCGR